ncbi:MAG: rhomboid family intramembrane serine protease [Candidatus Tectimicrobiota bacterium]
MAKMSVTPVFLGLNVLIFGVMLLLGVDPLRPSMSSLLHWGANFGPRTTQGEPWRLLTSMFLHIGILHLLFNMVALWNIGRFIERLIGSTGFVVLYMLSGLTGSLASVLWNPIAVSAGASGAIFGLFGGLLGFLVRHRDTAAHSFLATLRSNTLAFLGYNLLFGMVQEGIDMAAHLGGLGGGFLCGMLLTQPLTLASRARRRLRSLLVGAVGLGLVGLAIAELPRAEDLDAALHQLSLLDQSSQMRFQEVALQFQSRKLSAAAFEDVLTREIVPPWQAQRGTLLRLLAMRLPQRYKQHLNILVRYMDVRQESWELLYDGLTRNDQRLWRQGEERQRQAVQLMQQLQPPGRKQGR